MTQPTTDTQPDAVTLSAPKWTSDVIVSVHVDGAPEITAPCGHGLRPDLFVMHFQRGNLPESVTDAWDLVTWQIEAFHHGEEEPVSLKPEHFGEEPVDAPEFLQGILSMLGLPTTADRLGPIPEWVHTAIKSYQPTTDGPGVRTAPTYHG